MGTTSDEHVHSQVPQHNYDYVRKIAKATSKPLLLSLITTLSTTSTSIAIASSSTSTSKSEYKIPTKGFQSKSGLKYFDVREGDGPTPRYGQLISFAYATYYKASPESKIEKLDDSGNFPFVHKHGNGRIIRGVDEALHTMRPGGQRRIIVPKNLGYTDFGLGPLPSLPKRRKRLGDILDYVDRDLGQLIFDLQLIMVKDDENDQGYYDDVAVSQEEVRELAIKALRSKNGNSNGGGANGVGLSIDALQAPKEKDITKDAFKGF